MVLIITNIPTVNYNSQRKSAITVANKCEIQLLKGLREHDEQSFSKLYDNYSAALYGVVSRIVKNEVEAEDVLQETFVKIINNLHLYDEDKSRLFTWMARVAINKSLDYLRTATVVKETNNVSFVDLAEEKKKSLQTVMLNIDAIGVKQLTYELQPSQKQVIDLIYFKGYTQLEVSEELNIPLGTVKTKVRLAILSLRRKFSYTIAR